MKILWAVVRLLPSVGAIVLAVLSMKAQGDQRTALLCACVCCLTAGTVLNMRAQRRMRAEQEASEEAAHEEAAHNG